MRQARLTVLEERALIPTATAERERLLGSEMLSQAFTRAAGASLISGNSVRLLKDATTNYPAWLAEMQAAERSIFLENYIFCEDEIGERFAQCLADKARAGVRVRVIYDWVGCFGRASARFWRRLRESGAQVRGFNRPRLIAPFSWPHRDHRKLLTVDGRVGFITGLCIGRDWAGDPDKGIPPWRDTGVEVRGPALEDMEKAFAQAWAATGGDLPPEDLTDTRSLAPAGAVALRVVASAPGTAAMLRLDQLVAAAARRSLWITDAYFAGIPPYVQALRSAALDGVDVRLLVPGVSDIPILRPLSEAGYRPLLEAGVRVFEWNGPMLHAKTAVADGRWARVGSSNLNLASWIGNYELDALIEDEPFSERMEQMYEEDLASSTEIILERRRQRRAERSAEGGDATRLPASRAPGRPPRRGRRRSAAERSHAGSATRAAAGALRIGRTVGAALSEQRVLAPTEARLVAGVGLIALIAAGLVLWQPWVAAVPAAIVLIWAMLALFAQALHLYRQRRRLGLPTTRITRTAAGAHAPAALPQGERPG